VGHRPSIAPVEPGFELVEGHAGLTIRGRAFPQQLLARDRPDEVGPSLVGVVGEDAARPLAVGQVEVLGVSAERVGPVAPAGDRDGLAGADHHGLIARAPALGHVPAPALEVAGSVTLHRPPAYVPGGHLRVAQRFARLEAHGAAQWYLIVDFPLPDGPTIATISPAAIARSTPRSASYASLPLRYTFSTPASSIRIAAA